MTDLELNDMAVEIAAHVANKHIEDICKGIGIVCYDPIEDGNYFTDDAHNVWQGIFEDTYNEVIKHGTQHQSE